MHDVCDVYEFPTDRLDLITIGVKHGGRHMVVSRRWQWDKWKCESREVLSSALLKLTSLVMPIPSQPPKINELSLKDLFLGLKLLEEGILLSYCVCRTQLNTWF